MNTTTITRKTAHRARPNSRRIRRPAGILAWLTSVLLASMTAAPAAFASTSRGPSAPAPRNLTQLPGWNKHPPLLAHATVSGGMSGWQITLIAAGAAALAAAVAVLVQVLAARRQATPTAA